MDVDVAFDARVGLGFAGFRGSTNGCKGHRQGNGRRAAARDACLGEGEHDGVLEVLVAR